MQDNMLALDSLAFDDDDFASVRAGLLTNKQQEKLRRWQNKQLVTTFKEPAFFRFVLISFVAVAILAKVITDSNRIPIATFSAIGAVLFLLFSGWLLYKLLQRHNRVLADIEAGQVISDIAARTVEHRMYPVVKIGDRVIQDKFWNDLLAVLEGEFRVYYLPLSHFIVAIERLEPLSG